MLSPCFSEGLSHSLRGLLETALCMFGEENKPKNFETFCCRKRLWNKTRIRTHIQVSRSTTWHAKTRRRGGRGPHSLTGPVVGRGEDVATVVVIVETGI